MERINGNRKRPQRLHSPALFTEINADWVDLLASAIILQAVRDYRHLESTGRKQIADGVVCTKETLLAWFDSRWCANLLQRTDFEPQWIKDRLQKNPNRRGKKYAGNY